MPGGLLQLSAYGSQNEYLNGNPQMTFFKVVYKRYTNFSMEYIRQNLNGPNQLDPNNNIKLTCKISRNADLIFNTFFVFNIPDIYSGYDPQTNIAYKFNWIEELGNFIIYKTSISIGSTMIEQHYGDWMAIWSQFNVSQNLKNSYNTLIGNLPEIFDPADLVGNNGMYPTSTLDPNLDRDPDYSSVSTAIMITPYQRPPSILRRRIYVPLVFWFCNNSGLALPLIALQYHDVFFNIELRPSSQLYTVIETNLDSPNFGLRVRPSPNSANQLISNFIIPGSPVDFPAGINEQIGQFTNNNSWNLDPHLLINYIFLDNNERKKFAQTSHEYLITQVRREEHLGIIGNKTINLNLHHPVKQLIWTTKRNDMENRNIYNNYTNWEFRDINPFTFSYINTVTQQFNNTNLNQQIILSKIPTKETFKYFFENILKSVELKFDGQIRERQHDEIFYNFLQPYTTSYSDTNTGVYSYSFELDNYKFQPSGSANMSRINSFSVLVETQETPTTVCLNETLQYKYVYDLTFYAINYNILRFMSGMAGITFSN